MSALRDWFGGLFRHKSYFHSSETQRAHNYKDEKEMEGPDHIAEEIRNFHDCIEKSKDLPDAFLGKEIYVYEHLIKAWFKYLSLKYSHDRDMVLNMTENMLEYIHNMKEVKLCRFMIVEGNEELHQKYRPRYEQAKHFKREIEQAFAHALGEEAIILLESINRLSLRCFDKHGHKAPDGYQFNKYETDIEKSDES